MYASRSILVTKVEEENSEAGRASKQGQDKGMAVEMQSMEVREVQSEMQASVFGKTVQQ